MNELLIKDPNNYIWEIMMLQEGDCGIYRYLYTKLYEDQRVNFKVPTEIEINSFMYKMVITIDENGYLSIEKKERFE